MTLFPIIEIFFGILFYFTDNCITLRDGEQDEFRYYNVGVLMASRLDSPFDLERCGPAVDLALEDVNDKFLRQHRIQLRKVQAR